MDQLLVQWRISPYDLRHGIPRDAVPHVVAALVGLAWTMAPDRDGADALRWLGAFVLVVQVVVLVRIVARHVGAARAAEHVLTVHGDRFVVTDRRGATRYDGALVGVVDDAGVLRLEFDDGRVLEAPWRAFRAKDLRGLRRLVRSRLGETTDLQHVPVRAAGRVTGTGAWPRPLVALVVAGVLATLPWWLPAGT